MAAVTVDVQVASGDGSIPSPSVLRDWVSAAARHAAGPGRRRLEISLRVVDADEMQSLNRRFRGKDAPTNVLSFAADDLETAPAALPRALGDIVVCAPVVAAEAREQGKAPGDHWAHMLVHGTLHLLGFDHETAAEAARMEGLETAILAARNVRDPYS